MSRGPLYISEYNDGRVRRSKRSNHLGGDVAWDLRLAPAWRHLAIGPIWIEVNRDANVGAERWLGFDEEDQPCFCRHRFPVGDTHREDLTAWRLRDGRWLIHRVISLAPNGRTAYEFHTFSERMPR